MTRFLICSIAVAVFVAQPVFGADLVDILHRAQEHDAHWAAARAARAAGEEKRSQATALFMPTLSLTGNYQSQHSDVEYKGTTPFTAGDNRYETGDYGANLTLPLFRAQNIAQSGQLRSQAALAGRQYDQARQEFLLRVAQSYFEVQIASDSLELTEAEIVALIEQRNQADARFRAGVGTVTDLHDAKSRLALANARRIAAQNELALKRQALARVAGPTTEALAGLGPETRLTPPSPNAVEPWIEQARSRNPVLLAQDEAVRVAEREVDRNRGAHYPTLDAVAAYSHSRSTGSLYTDVGSEINSRRAGVELQLPLFQGGATASRVREALANLERTRSEREDTLRQVEALVREAFLSLEHGRALTESLNEAIFAAEQLADSARLGMQAGLRTRSDVLDAEQRLFGARREYTKARYDYLLNLLRLQAAAGSLDEQAVAAVNRFLNVPPLHSTDSATPAVYPADSHFRPAASKP